VAPGAGFAPPSSRAQTALTFGRPSVSRSSTRIPAAWIAGLNVDTPRKPPHRPIQSAHHVREPGLARSRPMSGTPAASFTATFKNGVLDGDLVSFKAAAIRYMTLGTLVELRPAGLRAKGLKSIPRRHRSSTTTAFLPAGGKIRQNRRPALTARTTSCRTLLDGQFFQSVEFRVVPNEDMHRVDWVVGDACGRPTLRSKNHIGLAFPDVAGARAGRVALSKSRIRARWDRVVFHGAPCRPKFAPPTAVSPRGAAASGRLRLRHLRQPVARTGG